MNGDKYIQEMIKDLTKTTQIDWLELTSTAALLELDGIISDWRVSQTELRSEETIAGLTYTGESIESRHISWIERYYNAKGRIEGAYKIMALITDMLEALTPDEEEDNVSRVFLPDEDEITMNHHDRNQEMMNWILDKIKTTDNEEAEEEEEEE